MPIIYVYTDGASRGNPGPASYGCYVVRDKDQVTELYGRLGDQTNNFAEYTAVIKALEYLVEQKEQASKIILRTDSQLLVRQLSGQYKVKSEKIKPLYQEVKKLTPQFKALSFEHVLRDLNAEADRLANKALDSEMC